jgi:hypothetical protein
MRYTIDVLRGDSTGCAVSVKTFRRFAVLWFTFVAGLSRIELRILLFGPGVVVRQNGCPLGCCTCYLGAIECIAILKPPTVSATP